MACTSPVRAARLRPAYDRSERRSGWEHKVSLPAIASLGALLLLANMARTEQSKEQLILIGVILLGVVLALAFGFMRKGSSGGS